MALLDETFCCGPPDAQACEAARSIADNDPGDLLDRQLSEGQDLVNERQDLRSVLTCAANRARNRLFAVPKASSA